MPRVVPSQVVDFIDGAGDLSVFDNNAMRQIDAAALSGLLNLLDELPQELLALDAESYVDFVCCKARVRAELERWKGNTDLRFGPWLTELLHDALARIRRVISRCPDQAPAPATTELKFIADADLRENLRIDIGAVERALSSGEWKAVTVLAGSVIEALLHWSLQQRSPVDITNATTALLAAKELKRPPDPNLDRWDLHEFTEVCANLAIIKADTHTETRLARQFRNLIHPGRAQRIGQKCDRGTALSSVAALDHVVRDLS
jgi:hypothetical protein